MQQVLDLRTDKRVKVEGTQGRAMMSVRMNNSMKPFDDVRVRQAFNYGIDQGKLVQSILQGTGEGAKSILPPIVADYDPSLFSYGFDPAKGRALLAEAGYPNGVTAELLFSDVNWWEEQMAVQVADQLKSIGCTITPRHITSTEINARGAPAKQDLPFFTYEDGPIVLDPVYTLALLAESKGVSNRCRYDDPKLDALVLQGRTTLDTALRDAAMKQAQKIWEDDAPWILTCYAQLFEAMAPNVTGAGFRIRTNTSVGSTCGWLERPHRSCWAGSCYAAPCCCCRCCCWSPWFTFLLLRLGGQDPSATMAGPTASTQEITLLRTQYGLDRALAGAVRDLVRARCAGRSRPVLADRQARTDGVAGTGAGHAGAAVAWPAARLRGGYPAWPLYRAAPGAMGRPGDAHRVVVRFLHPERIPGTGDAAACSSRPWTGRRRAWGG